MKTRFIGDVHGLVYPLSLELASLPDDVNSVIQVGDMGVGFGESDYWHDSLDKMLQSVNGRFIRGNHDNPSKCREMSTWIKDGHIENDMMFIGGAWSIDHAWRSLGFNLWADEELSYVELSTLLDVYSIAKPKVMVTHDCPLSISNKLFIQSGKSFSSKQYATRTGLALEEMFKAHKPDLWIFGHWHFDADQVVDGTRFICLNELSTIDVNLETLEVD